ncbi:MAG: hypothetical protein JSV03_05850 [Planctomycetota bacterium]|nr:MAG: hypothetical protein JSV03_05850 [Planctomycetota bacterium]
MASYRNITSAILLAGFVVAAAGLPCPANENELRLVPKPQQVQWSRAAPLEVENDKVAIVTGEKAQPPEQYAAEMLQAHVAKRFKQQWPILSESREHKKYQILILLGRRTTHQMLNRLCSEHHISLDARTPGHDGYIIEFLQVKNRSIIIIGGSNPRGVIYGQDTLFQMLTKSNGRLVLTQASIKDRPSIPWRGRPQTTFMNYLRPGDLDCHMESRINFIDLRNNIYAFEPGAELDKVNISKVIKEAHGRGLIVYGTVNCGVKAHEYPDVIGTFKEFICLGVDGLWISFDDKGPGEFPELIVNDVLDLGRQNGITGSRIAIAPPKGSYQNIITDFNRCIMAIPDMENALWFWTRWPSERSLQNARSIGLKCKPAWWHNWPRLYAHHSYIEPPSMAVGWHAPSYQTLADAGRYADAIMPWGGNAWGQYYVIPVIGWWGWNPKGHKWETTRQRIYDIVFGPGQVVKAMTFDDTLIRTKSLLRYSSPGDKWQPCCPVRLANLKDRQRVSDLIEKMKALLADLETRAPAETMLEVEQLETSYLQRMKAELQTFEIAAQMPYPEYWWEPQQRKVLKAIYDGDLIRADRLITGVRDKLLNDMARISDAGKHLRRIDDYVSWWNRRAILDAREWQAMLADRRKELTRRVWEYGYYVASPEDMLAPLKDPPLDWGSGRWQAGNRILATVLPTKREYAWGNWIGGLYRYRDLEAAVFAARRKSQAMVGEFSELELNLPVSSSGKRDKLALLFFVNSANKDKIGAEYTTARWAGYRFLELLWEDQLLWEADLGLSWDKGEWFMVNLPEIPEDIETLTLRLRVIDRKMLTVNHTIVFVGPIRLIERQE